MADWKSKIEIGMKLIAEGCNDANDDDCRNCPFKKQCHAVELWNCDIPMDWEINKKEII